MDSDMTCSLKYSFRLKVIIGLLPPPFRAPNSHQLQPRALAPVARAPVWTSHPHPKVPNPAWLPTGPCWLFSFSPGGAPPRPPAWKPALEMCFQAPRIFRWGKRTHTPGGCSSSQEFKYYSHMIQGFIKSHMQNITANCISKRSM